jgi:predicted component of type VI protein secretion system
MDCKAFKSNHAAFSDGFLGEADLVSMQRHAAECSACSSHDAAVRRALMVFRNLPSIEPSAEFSSRLGERLRAERLRGPSAGRPSAPQGPGVGTFASMAAGMMAVGYLAVAAFGASTPQDLVLPPVVASRPAPTPSAPSTASTSPMANSAVVASAAAGMALWSAALVAEQAPAHFAANEFRLASWSR